MSGETEREEGGSACAGAVGCSSSRADGVLSRAASSRGHDVVVAVTAVDAGIVARGRALAVPRAGRHAADRQAGRQARGSGGHGGRAVRKGRGSACDGTPHCGALLSAPTLSLRPPSLPTRRAWWRCRARCRRRRPARGRSPRAGRAGRCGRRPTAAALQQQQQGEQQVRFGGSQHGPSDTKPVVVMGGGGGW